MSVIPRSINLTHFVLCRIMGERLSLSQLSIWWEAGCTLDRLPVCPKSTIENHHSHLWPIQSPSLFKMHVCGRKLEYLLMFTMQPLQKQRNKKTFGDFTWLNVTVHFRCLHILGGCMFWNTEERGRLERFTRGLFFPDSGGVSPPATHNFVLPKEDRYKTVTMHEIWILLTNSCPLKLL